MLEGVQKYLSLAQINKAVITYFMAKNLWKKAEVSFLYLQPSSQTDIFLQNLKKKHAALYFYQPNF